MADLVVIRHDGVLPISVWVCGFVLAVVGLLGRSDRCPAQRNSRNVRPLASCTGSPAEGGAEAFWRDVDVERIDLDRVRARCHRCRRAQDGLARQRRDSVVPGRVCGSTDRALRGGWRGRGSAPDRQQRHRCCAGRGWAHRPHVRLREWKRRLIADAPPLVFSNVHWCVTEETSQVLLP